VDEGVPAGYKLGGGALAGLVVVTLPVVSLVLVVRREL